MGSFIGLQRFNRAYWDIPAIVKYRATSSWEDKEQWELEDFGSADGRMPPERTPKVVDSGGVIANP